MFIIEGMEKVRKVIEENRNRKLTKHKKLSNNTVIVSGSAALGSASCSASLNKSICSYPSAYFSLEEPNCFLCASASLSESSAFINSNSFVFSFRSWFSVSSFDLKKVYHKTALFSRKNLWVVFLESPFGVKRQHVT